MDNKKRLIVSVTSDIGFEIAMKWKSDGFDVIGTYRTFTNKCNELENKGIKLIHCDLNNRESIDNTLLSLNNFIWNVVVFAAGNMSPMGAFENININEWEDSIYANFTGQHRLLRGILDFRDKFEEKGAKVIFFAGGGTNNATVNYSAYTVSKIACIKMCELLNAEIKDTSFTIIGPGWVNTKIHQSTIKTKIKFQIFNIKTMDMLEGDDCTSIDRIIECCEWIISANRETVSGRNFSVVNDPWDSEQIKIVNDDDNIFKLRRFGNNLFRKT